MIAKTDHRRSIVLITIPRTTLTPIIAGGHTVTTVLKLGTSGDARTRLGRALKRVARHRHRPFGPRRSAFIDARFAASLATPFSTPIATTAAPATLASSAAFTTFAAFTTTLM